MQKRLLREVPTTRHAIQLVWAGRGGRGPRLFPEEVIHHLNEREDVSAR